MAELAYSLSMWSSSGYTFLFIDSNPATVDAREHQLVQSKARGHAASVSHRARAIGTHYGSEHTGSSAPSITGSRGSNQAKDLEVRSQFNHSAPQNPVHSLATFSKWSQQKVPSQLASHQFAPNTPAPGVPSFSRWRLNRKGSRKTTDAKNKSPAIKDSFEHHKEPSLSPAMYKGNSDPFSSTPVPLTAHQFSLIKLSRSASISAVWASEISMRPRNETFTDELCRSMGFIFVDPAVVHANLAFAYVAKVACQGQFQAKDMLTITREKNRALRLLRLLVEQQSQPDQRDKLGAIKDATTLLGACEIFLGDDKTAVIHSAAATRVFGLLGGLRSLPRFELEKNVHAAVAMASRLHVRPLSDPDEFDPGPWRSHRSTDLDSDISSSAQPLATHSMYNNSRQSSWTSELGNVGVSSVSTPSSSDTISEDCEFVRPTTVCLRLRTLLKEFRELLVIEEIKVRGTSLEFQHCSQPETVLQMFRWSHLRTSAIRGRGLNHWCDLVESKNNSQKEAFSGPGTGPNNTFDMCLCLAMRLLDRCIFQEPYLRTDLWRQAQTLYGMLISSLGEVQPVFDETSQPIDKRAYDMLWIYSVGAHTEKEFLQKKQPTPSSYHHFSDLFGSLARRLGFKDFEEIGRFLRVRYLYCSRLQDSTLRDLVDFG